MPVICSRSLASVPPHAHTSPKAPFILLEYFRLSRQEVTRGFAWTYRRNRPRVVMLAIVPA
ncbi:hypothetical protein [Streptomyces sp. NPDC001422]|uniref:hypothetical protein n=1 Tax=Streptomyces sp. NPDC001422 TaxID=3364575 RepID=UPI0036B069BB